MTAHPAGALVPAELTLGLYSHETGRDVEACVRKINLRMESSFGDGAVGPG